MAKHSQGPRPPAQNRTDSRPLDDAEIVSGRWLVTAILAVLALAGIALYLSFCLLLYQGQWQLTFFPPKGKSPSAASMAAASGLPIASVSFDTTEEGANQLNGWWIPATPATPATTSQPQSSADSNKLAPMVLLYCPNGRTDLPGNIDSLQAFHALGISVFAFDYRGFGASQHGHPSQKKAYADGIAALHYLTGIRRLDPTHIVVYGAGLGAAVAATVARQSPKIAGIILENPQPSLTRQVKREQHIHLLPMGLLFQDSFDISRTMPQLNMPKLILFTSALPEYAPGAAEIYAKSPAPRQKVQLHPGPGVPPYTLPEWSEAVRSFLNTLTARTAQ